MSAAYSAAPLMAALKILGLVVTPTTPLFFMRAGNACASVDVILARDRSSNQIEVPSAATS
jgi:hypothetical protein